jgi:hypothetical protein
MGKRRLLLVTCVGLGFAASQAAGAEGQWLGDWLRLNEPIVIRYLRGLSDHQIGQRLPGVTLSDGTHQLRDAKYLGPARINQPGTHAYRFLSEYRGRKFEIHYVWLDEGAPPLKVPPFPCAGTWLEPGGIAVLSGDQFTESALSPGILLVTTCALP